MSCLTAFFWILCVLIQSKWGCTNLRIPDFEVTNKFCNRSAREFRCLSGQCIDLEELCNGRIDCEDGSDETRVACLGKSCDSRAFRCDYGACASFGAECDGVKDCPDGSDELPSRCPRSKGTADDYKASNVCPSDGFECDDNRCVLETKLCDGRVDCADGSDESPATCGSYSCPLDAFICTYGACIDNSLKCDGVNNCADGSDETHHLCGSANNKTSENFVLWSTPPLANSDEINNSVAMRKNINISPVDAPTVSHVFKDIRLTDENVTASSLYDPYVTEKTIPMPNSQRDRTDSPLSVNKSNAQLRYPEDPYSVYQNDEDSSFRADDPHNSGRLLPITPPPRPNNAYNPDRPRTPPPRWDILPDVERPRPPPPRPDFSYDPDRPRPRPPPRPDYSRDTDRPRPPPPPRPDDYYDPDRPRPPPPRPDYSYDPDRPRPPPPRPDYSYDPDRPRPPPPRPDDPYNIGGPRPPPPPPPRPDDPYNIGRPRPPPPRPHDYYSTDRPDYAYDAERPRPPAPRPDYSYDPDRPRPPTPRPDDPYHIGRPRPPPPRPQDYYDTDRPRPRPPGPDDTYDLDGGSRRLPGHSDDSYYTESTRLPSSRLDNRTGILHTVTEKQQPDRRPAESDKKNAEPTTTRKPAARTSTSGPKQSTTESSSEKESCEVPEQPKNGEWLLEKSQCPTDDNCRVNETVASFEPGTQLIYKCDKGHKLTGTPDVFCGIKGKWSKIPVCEEIRCPVLSSASREAECSFDDNWISCDASVPPTTSATLICRNSYTQDMADLTRRDNVRCNSKGVWEPQPINCISVCGVASSNNGTPLIVNGSRTSVSEFPWHGTLYKLSGKEKKFICGATIIKDDLLVTAAHCVYDELEKKLEAPSKFYVAAGNIFRDYDYEGHDPRTIKKARVKRIFVVCNYLGLEGNYASDVALLQIDKPFVFSSLVMPICLDIAGASDQTVLDVGNYGRVPGFGGTERGASSFVLQSLAVPYVSLSACKASSIASESERYLTIDKFCAGYTNGSSVCNGDSGGGLVFKTDNHWYLRGIVSVGIGLAKSGASRTCNSYAYSLYTRVSNHMDWIQDITTCLEANKSCLNCS